MFAVLHASPDVPLDALVEVAQAFTPRFQVVGSFVVLDVSGLSSMFGTAEALSAALWAARPECRSMAMASTVSAAMLLACGRQGRTLVASADERAAIAELPLAVLIEVVRARGVGDGIGPPPLASDPSELRRGLAKAALQAAAAENREPGAGNLDWRHPRDTHQAQHTRPPRASALSTARSVRSSRTVARSIVAIEQCAATLDRWGIRTVGALAALPRPDVHARLGELGVSWQRLASGEDDGPLVPWLAEPVFEERVDLEWPVEGFEPLSFVLPRLLEPLSARLERADRGAVAIRTALGLTTRQVHLRVLPLPAPMRDPKTLRTLVLLDLESHPPDAPIDVVQVRLEPTPGRVLQWTFFERAQPAPEQVATLVARLTAVAGEGHVGTPVLVDSWRPGAWAMGTFQAHPPSHSRASAGQAAAPAFALTPFGATSPPHTSALSTSAPVHPCTPAPCLAFRRFRLPVPVRVQMEEGRPVRVTTDRRGLAGGVVVQAAGPWRTSGAWWGTATHREWGVGSGEWGVRSRESRGSVKDVRDGRQEAQPVLGCERPGPAGESGRLPTPDSPLPSRSIPWDRDEWDVAIADGTVYRLFVEREVGQWFLEGVFD